MMGGKKMNPKELKFCDEYIKTGNAKQSALTAGYSKNFAISGVYRMMEREHIKKYIAKRMKEVEDASICSLAEIQKFRTKVIRNEETDAFGMDLSAQDRLKAAEQLEKALNVQKEYEESKQGIFENNIFHTDLDCIADCFHPLIRDIRNHKHNEYVLAGGRGSTKSSCASLIPLELLLNNPNLHMLVVRKVADTLRDSVYSQIQWAIEKQAETNPLFDSSQWQCKTSPLEITYKPTGQKIFFRGCDDWGKIKSIKPPFGYIGIVLFEEADQFHGDEEIRKVIQSAIRGGSDTYIFKLFNPPKTKSNFMNKYVEQVNRDEELQKTVMIHKSTYHDVPEEWLGEGFLEEAEKLKRLNPDAYENEYEGAVNFAGGSVFTNLEIRPITKEEKEGFGDMYVGVDFGWEDPFASVQCYYNPNKLILYITKEIYKKHLKNDDAAKEMKEKYDIKTYNTAVCDCAEPKSIADLRVNGITAAPCQKGAKKGGSSIREGIKWLQSQKAIVIDSKECPNTAKEFEEYEYIQDKHGNTIDDYPDKNNHSIDATRYALQPYYKWGGN
jgi:PBSX family phage terminase large subunit